MLDRSVWSGGRLGVNGLVLEELSIGWNGDDRKSALDRRLSSLSLERSTVLRGCKSLSLRWGVKLLLDACNLL